jgi:hypothetical protein
VRQLDEAERVPAGHWLRLTMHLSELAVAVAHLPVIPTKDEWEREESIPAVDHI